MEDSKDYRYSSDISLRAKGILALALDLQANGIMPSASELTRHCNEGYALIKSALTELTNEGYLIINIDPSEPANNSHKYYFYSTPHEKSNDRVMKEKFKQRIYY